MPNLRIIFDNAADRATITASSTAPGLSVASLLTDTKSDAHRSVGTSVSYTLALPYAEIIGGVHMPWTNCSPTASIRVRGYSDAGGTTQVFDTGTIFACPAPSIKLRGWPALTAASAYAYGGGAHCRAWLANSLVRRLVIDIVDTANLQGYIECGRIVAGEWWEPEYNADYGASVARGSSSKQFRTDAGDLITDIGTKHGKQSISLSSMAAPDRATLMGIQRGNDLDAPVIFSLYPNDTDAALERDHQGYYKFVSTPAMSTPGYERYATSIELETV